MVSFIDYYNAITIDRLPSKTKVGKDSGCANNSLLSKSALSWATKAFFNKKNRDSPSIYWWEYTKLFFKGNA